MNYQCLLPAFDPPRLKVRTISDRAKVQQVLLPRRNVTSSELGSTFLSNLNYGPALFHKPTFCTPKNDSVLSLAPSHSRTTADNNETIAVFGGALEYDPIMHPQKVFMVINTYCRRPFIMLPIIRKDYS